MGMYRDKVVFQSSDVSTVLYVCGADFITCKKPKFIYRRVLTGS